MKILLLDKGYIELQLTMGSDYTILDAARTSKMGHSTGVEGDKRLLFYLMEHEHMSPFEFGVMQIRVKCPIFTARQWMRHRVFSYNELSRRYTSENIEFYIPDQWRAQDIKNKQASNGIIDFSLSEDFNQTIENCLNLYNRLIDNGVAREMARMVLPQNLYTRFVMIGNVRNLLHFCHLRCAPDAQWEIQQYVNVILHDFIKDKFPWTYEAYLKFGSK